MSLEPVTSVTGRAVFIPGADIDTDHIESIPDLPLTEEDTDFLSSKPPGQ